MSYWKQNVAETIRGTRVENEQQHWAHEYMKCSLNLMAASRVDMVNNPASLYSLRDSVCKGPNLKCEQGVSFYTVTLQSLHREVTEQKPMCC